MAKRESLVVTKREIFGKQLKKLRREGVLPGNIYGKAMKSSAVQLPLAEFKPIFNIVHETGLVDLKFGDEVIPVLIHNVQLDGRSREPLHADFFKVNLKEKISAKIPVISTGEAKAEADKIGLLEQPLMEIEVEALPTDLPEHIEVNVEKLAAVDEQILVSDLVAPEGVTILTDGGQLVFKIGELVTKEMEEQAAADEAETAEAAAEETTEEGASEEGGEEKTEGEEGEKSESEEKPAEEAPKSE
jgi:large subunit ribosomal protein L25